MQAVAAANAIATQRSRRRPRGTFQPERPHPSRGGNAYSDDIRHDVLTRYHLGLPLQNVELDLLRAAQPPAYPCMQTCMNFIERERQYGHCRAKHATGTTKRRGRLRGNLLCG